MRRELIFRFSGTSSSPVLDHLLQTGLDARIELTSITPEGVGCLVTVTGQSDTLASFANLLDRVASTVPRDVKLLSMTDGQIVYFGFCATPPGADPQLAQLAERELGPTMSYEARIQGGTFIVTVRAPVDAPLETFYKNALAQLSRHHAISLERLGPAQAQDAALPLSLQDEQILLAALQAGYFAPKRAAGIREIGSNLGKRKSSIGTALRRAIGRLVDCHLAAGPQTRTVPSLTFEYWGGIPRSAHYAMFLATPELSARVESVNVQPREAWQIVIAQGPPALLADLRDVVEWPPTSPIRSMEVLHHARGVLVYFDHWTRPTIPSQGVSLEHVLHDHCGHAGHLRIHFRHGVARVQAVGPLRCLEAFFADVIHLMGNRFEIERIAPRAGVTDAEDETRVLRVARDQGYFEVPRRVGLDGVGCALDVSASTAGNAIRRALRHAILAHVQGARRAEGLRGANAE